ncbi:hypothetical protein K1719_027094 [Acacia pycnantha]|nr:hypothetical protein K1719_027094 [Acacia pycnantha]
MIRIRSNLSVFSVVLLIRQNLYSVNHSRIFEQLPNTAFNFLKPSVPASFPAPPQFGFSALFSSSSPTTKVRVTTDVPTLGFDETSGDDDEELLDELDKINHTNLCQLDLRDDGLGEDVKTILDILRGAGCRPSEIKFKLEHCNITVSSELVVEVLSRIRNDWEAAFTFFLWAGKQPNYVHSVREYHSMIYILGKMRKFDTAWTLIEEMRRGSTGPSLVTPQTLLIMIRRYCAVRDVGKAISTFYAYKRFNFQVGMEEFQGLLSALCRYKNVEDAEHLLFCNKNREFGRRWAREESNMMLSPMQASCLAIQRLLNFTRFVKEAVNLLRTMEDANISPDTVTYNSLINPLCKAHKIDEAKEILDEMVQRGLSPTIRTYHAFPWQQLDVVFKLWSEMRESGVNPDRSSYIVLIHGLFFNGKLEEAYKYYNEMQEKGFLPEPKTNEMLQAWLSAKQVAVGLIADFADHLNGACTCF